MCIYLYSIYIILYNCLYGRDFPKIKNKKEGKSYNEDNNLML